MNNCPFKKFKNIFGIPGKGAHSYRILNTAMVDYLLTIILSFVTSYLTGIPVVLTTIFWLIVGIVLHILFGVKTTTLKYFGVSC